MRKNGIIGRGFCSSFRGIHAKASASSGTRSSIVAFFLAAAWIAPFFLTQPLRSQNQTSPEMVNVDLFAASHPFPHFWERMFGSGRAILSLRESYRRDLQDVQKITGLEYIRIDQTLNFTLPPAAEGPSLEAQIDGSAIVFPLGPTPVLSWADCSVRTSQDQARIFWCSLKPGFRCPEIQLFPALRS